MFLNTAYLVSIAAKAHKDISFVVTVIMTFMGIHKVFKCLFAFKDCINY
jgi:hypothetical protein